MVFAIAPTAEPNSFRERTTPGAIGHRLRPSRVRGIGAPKENAMAPLIELSAVSKLYNGDRQHAALDSISMSIRAGQATAVMGPSGSGKSTLLNVIGGGARPSSGAGVRDGGDST